VAVIVAAVDAVTAAVVMVNVAVELPAATVTEGLTVAGAELDRETTMPPAGAAPLKVTVPVEDVPPVTLAGFTDTLDKVTAGGVMVSVAVSVTPLYLAVIVAVVDAVTAVVVMVNVAVELPAATVTVPMTGTVAEAELLDRETTMPPAGAAPLKVTVPVEDVPPVTLVGFTDTPDKVTAGGWMVSGAVSVTPLYLAVIVAVVDAVTAVVVMVNVALGLPAPTVSEALTVADVELLDRVTVMPPVGAAPLKVTVPVEEVPPATLAGFTDTPDSVTAGGRMVSEAVSVPELYVAVMVAVAELVTAVVATANVALAVPEAKETDEGTMAAELLLVSVTTAPPAGAGPVKVTVPCDAVPPVTEVGFSVRVDIATPPWLPLREMVTVELAAIATLSCICPP
jgi:hypothetical protein